MSEEAIALLSREFVPLAHIGPNWIVTATGKELKPSSEEPITVEQLRQALADFRKLPARERTAAADGLWPGLKDYPPLPTPPTDGLVLKQYTRYASRDADGVLHPTGGFGGIREPLVNYLWMTEKEWRSLVPREPRKGLEYALPDFLVRRIGLYHTFDPCIMGGGTPTLAGSDIRLTVEEVTAEELRLRLAGTLRRPSPYQDMAFHIDYELAGRLVYDRVGRKFRQLEFAMAGEVNNATAHMLAGLPDGHSRVIASFFELCRPDTPLEQVRPLGVDQRGYFGLEGP